MNQQSFFLYRLYFQTITLEILRSQKIRTQVTFNCSNLRIKTLEKSGNMFKVNNKNTRTTSYFTPVSSAIIADFEQVNVSWVNFKCLFNVV